MQTPMQGMGRAFIIAGAALAVFGALLLVVPKAPWIGRLPGDIRIEREHVRVYLPLASCLAASIVLSLLCWLVGRSR